MSELHPWQEPGLTAEERATRVMSPLIKELNQFGLEILRDDEPDPPTPLQIITGALEAHAADAGRALLAERDALREVAEMAEITLPLAKGYAAEHPVGSNAAYVAALAAALAKLEKRDG